MVLEIEIAFYWDPYKKRIHFTKNLEFETERGLRAHVNTRHRDIFDFPRDERDLFDIYEVTLVIF